jgi:hypothetical protein
MMTIPQAQRDPNAGSPSGGPLLLLIPPPAQSTQRRVHGIAWSRLSGIVFSQVTHTPYSFLAIRSKACSISEMLRISRSMVAATNSRLSLPDACVTSSSAASITSPVSIDLRDFSTPPIWIAALSQNS